MRKRILLAGFLALLFGAADASATVFCATTSTELQQALTTAASNGEADTIKIETGTYQRVGSPAAFNYNTSQNFSLFVEGGYTSIPPLRCVRKIQNPAAKVLSGSDVRQVLRLEGASGTNGELSLSNLTLRGGFSPQLGAGLLIGNFSGFSGRIYVLRVIIERNVGTQSGGGMKVASEGDINIRNNMFLLNRCSVSSCAFIATLNAVGATPRARFGNNTIVGNQCTSGSSCTHTDALFIGSADAMFYNNVFAANSNGDLDLLSSGGGTVDLYCNSIVSITGTAPDFSLGNIAFANPHFVDLLNDDLRPTLDSPLVNAGTHQFALQGPDLAGMPRINGGVVDIGAYENRDQVVVDAFELLE